MEHQFYFSIIMAVYNVEPFIDEAIQSLIEQDFGFEQNVQLILVNDGSPDNSGEICDKYKEEYPNNIVVIHKENGGVSSARNAGFPYVKGKYINFMDPDDKLSLNTLKNVFIFFEKNYDEIDLIEIPTHFFDGQTGEHILNKQKFSKGSRVIDLNEEYQCILMAISRMFVKNSCLDYINFDTRLVITEDGKEAQKLLLNNPKFGALTNCSYKYRKRTHGEESAIDTSTFKKEYYCNWLEHYALFTIKNAIEKYEYVPQYIQYTIMYDLQWKFKKEDIPDGILNPQEEAEFWSLLTQTIQYIDDDIIMEQKSIFIEHKLFILNLKYGKSANIIPIKNDAMMFQNNTFIRYLSRAYARIEFIKYENNQLIFEGRMMCFDFSILFTIHSYAIVNNIEYKCEEIEIKDGVYSLNKLIFKPIGFRFTLTVDDTIEKYEIQFMQEYNGTKIIKKDIRFSKFTPIGKELNSSYYYKDKHVLTFNKNTFSFKKCGKKGLIKQELKFLKSIKDKFENQVYKIALIRLYTRIKTKLNKKEIWLFSDRIQVADDNGKALFTYLCKKRPKNVRLYFLIDKNCPDYKKIKKIGKVIDYNSPKRKLFFLQTTNIISSAFDEYVRNPFQQNYIVYRDLLQQNFVFLQHGITKDDMSKVFNKYNKNIKLFVCAAKPEYKSILENNYNYSNKEVILTGFPRYDLLYNNPKKLVTIMPTWRKHLTTGKVNELGTWLLNDTFTNSDYYNFYNSLINSELLINKAKEHGYKIAFMPHPVFATYIDIFTKHKDVEFINFNKPYREVFAESDLIVNDYSSASMDFSYLRKPVIYAQFDKKDFFSKQYKPGYFSYEDNGFGEVEYDLDSTINRIIEYIENGCKLKDIYSKRIDDFFAHNDKNNCERVYKAILDL